MTICEKKCSYTLIFTSSLFLLPATYVLIYKKSVFSLISYSISISSINYWFDPNNKTKMLYDKCTSYIGCVLYIVNSLYYIPTIEMKFVSILIVFSYYLCFLLSCYLYNNNNNNWIYAHMSFHFLVFVSKWILYLQI